MSVLHTWSNGDVLYELHKQYPGTTSTRSACITGCGLSARGGGHCASCLGQELRRRGLSQHLLSTLCAALQKRAAASVDVEMAFAEAHTELRSNHGTD